MGRKAYTKTIRMAGTVPMPRKQTARDSRAMEGLLGLTPESVNDVAVVSLNLFQPPDDVL